MACTNCNADGGCGCVSNLKEINLGTKTIWTLGGTGAQGVAVIFGNERGLAISPTVVMQQGTLTVADASSGFKGIAGYQVSGDGVNWDAFVPFAANTFQAGNGTLVYDWYTAVVNYKKFIRYVVSAEQNAQNFIAIANVTLAVSIIIR